MFSICRRTLQRSSGFQIGPAKAISWCQLIDTEPGGLRPAPSIEALITLYASVARSAALDHAAALGRRALRLALAVRACSRLLP
jgi:hypothetical protein